MSPFTAEIDLALTSKLKKDLRDQGFEFLEPPYTLFQAKKKGLTCTLYKSGKLVVQGKEMGAFIEFYLEPEILQEFGYSHPEAHLNLTPHIGLDEAGKGDFFGPLCIGAVFANGEGIKKLLSLGVKDSKKLSDESVLKIAEKIRVEYPHVSVRLFPLKYNELHARFKNLNRMLAWAHTVALKELSEKTNCQTAIIDRFATENVMETALRQKHLAINLEQRVRGESDLVVAAASILARADFLRGLEQLGNEIGMILPKGASPPVLEAGTALVKKYGADIFTKVAKTHFKTKDQILAQN